MAKNLEELEIELDESEDVVGMEVIESARSDAIKVVICTSRNRIFMWDRFDGWFELPPLPFLKKSGGNE